MSDRLKAWLHWKRLELERGALDDDETMFYQDIKSLNDEILQSRKREKELEETISKLQIDHSKGYYTPFHEAERKKLKAMVLWLEEKLEAALKGEK